MMFSWVMALKMSISHSIELYLDYTFVKCLPSSACSFWSKSSQLTWERKCFSHPSFCTNALLRSYPCRSSARSCSPPSSRWGWLNLWRHWSTAARTPCCDDRAPTDCPWPLEWNRRCSCYRSKNENRTNGTIIGNIDSDPSRLENRHAHTYPDSSLKCTRFSLAYFTFKIPLS